MAEFAKKAKKNKLLYPIQQNEYLLSQFHLYPMTFPSTKNWNNVRAIDLLQQQSKQFLCEFYELSEYVYLICYSRASNFLVKRLDVTSTSAEETSWRLICVVSTTTFSIGKVTRWHIFELANLFGEFYKTTPLLLLFFLGQYGTIWTWLVLSKKIPMQANLYSHTGSSIKISG